MDLFIHQTSCACCMSGAVLEAESILAIVESCRSNFSFKLIEVIVLNELENFPNRYFGQKAKAKLLSRARLLATPWTAAYQALPSMGFSRQEYCSGVPLPSPDWSLTLTEISLVPPRN